MNFAKEDVILAFNNWLQSSSFYTGGDGDPKLSNWDGVALTAGSFVASVAIKTIAKKDANIPTSFSSAKDAEKAEPKLAELRNHFDFIGFRTKWSVPLLVLGLIADNLPVSDIGSLISKLPRQVSSLKSYGAGGTFFGIGGSLSTKFLLVYLHAETYESHCAELLSDGSKNNQPLGTDLRTCLIDLQGKQLKWSDMKILQKTKEVGSSSEKLFGQKELLQVLGYMA